MAFLAFLSAAARTVYPFIRRGVREGLSIEGIGRAFRSEGYKLANSTLRDLVRKERELQRVWSTLKFTNLDSRIDVRRLPEALTTLRRSYSFTVEVIGRAGRQGGQVTQHVTVSTDKRLTPREIMQAAEDAIHGGIKRYGIEIDSLKIVEGLRAGPQGTL
jgi:hypothetical protein